LVAVTACGGGAEDDAAAPDGETTGSGATATIRYGIASDQAIYWPQYIGIQEGFFEESGVTLELVRSQSGSATDLVQLLLADAVDLAGGLPDPVLAAVSQGAELQIINKSVPAAYAMVGKPGVGSYDELSNLGQPAKIAVSNLTTATAPVAEQMLSDAGVSDYELVVAGGSSDRLAAITAGVADAAVLLQPFDFLAEAQGMVVLSYSTESVPEYSSTEQTTTAYAEENCDTLRSYFAGLRESIEWFEDPANEAAAVAILVEETGVSEDEAQQTYDLFHDIAEPGVSDPTDAVAVTIDLLQAGGNLEQDSVTAEDAVSTECAGG